MDLDIYYFVCSFNEPFDGLCPVPISGYVAGPKKIWG